MFQDHIHHRVVPQWLICRQLLIQVKMVEYHFSQNAARTWRQQKTFSSTLMGRTSSVQDSMLWWQSRFISASSMLEINVDGHKMSSVIRLLVTLPCSNKDATSRHAPPPWCCYCQDVQWWITTMVMAPTDALLSKERWLAAGMWSLGMLMWIEDHPSLVHSVIQCTKFCRALSTPWKPQGLSCLPPGF